MERQYLVCINSNSGLSLARRVDSLGVAGNNQLMTAEEAIARAEYTSQDFTIYEVREVSIVTKKELV